jgi:hypothetical protein
MSVRLGLGFAVLMCVMSLGLAGCGEDDTPPPASFAPFNFSYLTKLRLNVGSIDVQDHSAPLGPDDVSAQSPVTPAQALQEIAHDRLFAAGLLGTAEFVIDQASIVRGAEGGLYGQMAVHLEVMTAGGQRAGYAEARVARQHLPGSDAENFHTVLYTMTRQMADAMNVELEYQLKRSMGDFLSSAAVVPSAVTVTPLSPGGAPPALPPATETVPVPQSMAPPPQNALPPETGGATPDEPVPEQEPPAQMSPPPGYLQLPPGPGHS